MNQFTLRTCIQPKFSITISLCVAFALLPSLCFGQSDKSFADLGLSTMSDSAIHEFVAIAKLENVIARKDEMLGLMKKIKKLSMESRLKHAMMALDSASKRGRQREVEFERLGASLKDLELKSQANSPVFVLSRASAEQLLISAQLELQKVNWDLASEEAMFEESAKELESKVKERSIEREMASLEVRVLGAEVEVAQHDLTIAEDLHQRKALGLNDLEKARLSVQKAKAAKELQYMRLSLLDAQQDASRNSHGAEIKSQIRKLKARKDQIEKYIKELLESTSSLSGREQIEARIGQIQKEVEQVVRLRGEWEVKVEEIEGLLATLNEVQLGEKKE